LHEGVVVWRQQPRWIGWRRPFSLGMGVVAGLLLFSLFVPAACLGWNANLRHLQTWYRVAMTKAVDVRQTGFGEHVRSMRNQSLDNAAYRFGNWLIRETIDGPDDTLIDDPARPKQKLPMDSELAGRLILVGRVAALTALLLVVLRVAASGEAIGSAASFGLACAATLVVGPVARGSYFLLVLPAVVFVSLWLIQLGRPRTALATAFVPAGLVWLYYVLLPVSGRTGLLGLGMAAWFFAVCALLERLLARKRSEWRQADPLTQLPGPGQDSSFAAAA
jgi:hypothetical protein